MADRPIDEDARRAFEAARIVGDDRPLASFLPDEAAVDYVGTLVELIVIEREFQWKRATPDAPPPSLDALLGAFPTLAAHPEAVAEIREEDDAFAARASEAPTASAVRLAPGAALGRYELREVVGRGAFAEVWRAFDPRLRREVALKICRTATVADDDARVRVLREARSAARLQHPAIVRVLEVGDHDGAPFIVSDLLPGPDLAKWLEDHAPSFEDAARWIARIARGLHYAHESGVIHRDLKPGNLLLNDVGLPVLTDFGLAHLGDADVRMTREGDVFGTPAYMAPEQARGDHDRVDARSDVYSLGVVLYELLCRRRPHPETSAAALLRAVIEREPPRPRRIARDIPRDLETIVLTAMAKESHRRYASASRLADDLERYLERRPIEARRRGLVGRALLWCRRNPAIAATIALAAVAVAVVSVVSFRRILDERDRTHDTLYRALVGEAESRIAARGTAWRSRALDRIAEAAKSPSAQRDPVELRSLAARCYGITAPSLRMTNQWDAQGDGVVALAFAADGRWFAEADRRGRLFVRDATTGHLRRTLVTDGARIDALAASPDGRWLAAGARDGVVTVWPSHALSTDATATTATTLDLGARVNALSFSPAGERLAVALDDGTVTMVSVMDRGPDAHPRLTARTFLTHDRALTAIAFATDGRTVAIGAEGASVIVRDAKDGSEIRRWRMVDPPAGLAASGDGFVFTRRVTFAITAVTAGQTPGLRASGSIHAGFVNGVVPAGPNEYVSWSDDGSIRVHIMTAAADNAGRLRAKATPGLGAIRRLAIGPHGRILIAATRTGTLSRWTISRPVVTDAWHTHHAATFVPRASTLVADRWTRDYATTGQTTQSPWTLPSIEAIDAAGESIVAGSADGRMRSVALRPDGATVTTLVANGAAIRRLAAAPDGRRIATVDERGVVRILDATAAPATHRTLHRTLAGLDGVQDLAWSDDGETLYAATPLGLMRTDPANGSASTLFAAAFRDGRVRRAGDRLAISGIPDGALLIDARTGATVADLGADATVLDATRRFVITRDDESGIVRHRHDVSDAAAANGLDRTPIPKSTTWDCAWAIGHDRLELLCVANDRYSSRLIDAETGRVIARLIGGSQHRATWCADGTLAIGTLDGSVLAWHARSLAKARRHARRAPTESTSKGDAVSQSILSLHADATPVSGMHDAPVWGIAISPNAEWIATTAHDGTAKLWSAARRERARDLDGHFGVAWCATFDRTSRSLFVGAGDVTRWRIDDPATPPVRTPRARSLVGGIACHPGRDVAVWARFDGTVEAWRYEDDAKPRTLHRARSVGRAVAFSIDGAELVVAYGDAGILRWRTEDAAFRDWLAGERADPPAPEVLRGHVGQVQAVAFSPDRRLFASADSAGTIVLRRARDFRVLATLQNDTRNIRVLSFDAAGRFLAAAAYAGRSTTWDLRRLTNHFRALGVAW